MILSLALRTTRSAFSAPDRLGGHGSVARPPSGEHAAADCCLARAHQRYTKKYHASSPRPPTRSVVASWTPSTPLVLIDDAVASMVSPGTVGINTAVQGPAARAPILTTVASYAGATVTVPWLLDSATVNAAEAVPPAGMGLVSLAMVLTVPVSSWRRSK
jgi:hypothetical protein